MTKGTLRRTARAAILTIALVAGCTERPTPTDSPWTAPSGYRKVDSTNIDAATVNLWIAVSPADTCYVVESTRQAGRNEGTVESCLRASDGLALGRAFGALVGVVREGNSAVSVVIKDKAGQEIARARTTDGAFIAVPSPPLPSHASLVVEVIGADGTVVAKHTGELR